MDKTNELSDAEIFKKACQNWRPLDQAREEESEPGFAGWVVCSDRPMLLTKQTTAPVSQPPTLWLSTFSTVFGTYEAAALALVDTWKLCQVKKYTWFDDNVLKPHYIFPLQHEAENLEIPKT